MREVTPDYYPLFRCSAGACQHTCCAGWEIDIDTDTLSFYKKQKGEMGERLRRHISDGSFVLDKAERCPFLNDKNLCDIIIELGETALCQVCRDHPRYRNFFSGVTEVGLGLCCEAAAGLILKNPKSVTFGQIARDEVTKEEWALIERRAAVISALQEKDKSITQRFSSLVSLPNLADDKWKALLLSLERLDEEWTEELQTLDMKKADLTRFEREAEQLAVYLVWRHFPNAERGDTCIRFAFLCVGVVTAMSQTKEQFIQNARLLSAEIEYSDENLAEIFYALEAEYGGF